MKRHHSLRWWQHRSWHSFIYLFLILQASADTIAVLKFQNRTVACWVNYVMVTWDINSYALVQYTQCSLVQCENIEGDISKESTIKYATGGCWHNCHSQISSHSAQSAVDGCMLSGGCIQMTWDTDSYPWVQQTQSSPSTLWHASWRGNMGKAYWSHGSEFEAGCIMILWPISFEMSQQEILMGF